VAHCQYNNTYDDSLVVMVSTDCQNTWSEVYRKGGPDLATIAASTNDYLTPAVGDFRQECVNLNGMAFATLYVKFKGYNGYGNNIYLDNIEITNQDCNGSTTQLDEIKNSNIQLYPNPSNGRSTLMFGAELLQDAKVNVYNALGELVHQQWLIRNTQQMDLQGEFAEGVYMIAVQSGNTISHLRWVVKK
jgi:hypothetical protein